MNAFVWTMAATFAAGLIVLAVVAVVAWRGRRARANEEVLDRLRELFAADETVPLDVGDGPWNRSEREVHHMTASGFTEMNTAFAGLIEANWPDQT